MKPRKSTPYCVSRESIRFICEQDGQPEQRLKRELSDLFVRDKKVSIAYLVRIGFDVSDEYLVALCLRVDSGRKLRRVKKVAKVFSKIFGADQHLEIMFLDESTETRLQQVCSPFYSKGIQG